MRVSEYRVQAIKDASLQGDRFYCEKRVKNGVLYVRGESCMYKDWFCTGDRAAINEHVAMYYLARVQNVYPE
jgi:hypothetical protein